MNFSMTAEIVSIVYHKYILEFLNSLANDSHKIMQNIPI